MCMSVRTFISLLGAVPDYESQPQLELETEDQEMAPDDESRVDYYSPLIHRLMCTNEPPLDDESSQIQTIFREAPQHLSQLDEEIRRTSSEDDLAHLRRKRHDLELLLTDKLRILSHILSPVRRFPAELIAEIALHVLDRYTAFPIPVSLETRTIARRKVDGTAWTLAQVCRSWRSNLISFPKLWSVVLVNLPTPNSIPIVAELLRRSTPSLLVLIIGIVKEKDSSVSETVDLCLGHAHRWKELRIADYTRSNQTLAKFNTIKDALPRLESLNLVIMSCENLARQCSTLGAFESAPRLRKVVFRLWADGPEVPQIPLPWRQLDYYSNMQSVGARGNPLRNPLSSFSNLRECSFPLYG